MIVPTSFPGLPGGTGANFSEDSVEGAAFHLHHRGGPGAMERGGGGGLGRGPKWALSEIAARPIEGVMTPSDCNRPPFCKRLPLLLDTAPVG